MRSIPGCRAVTMDLREKERKMRVLDSELMKGYARMAMDGFNQGWHERSGGKLSYRMKAEEVEAL